jgi:X-X-X-Leu-X-X-Gly heptad repeat protein
VQWFDVLQQNPAQVKQIPGKWQKMTAGAGEVAAGVPALAG